MVGRLLTTAALSAFSMSAAAAAQLDITNANGAISNQFLSSIGALDSDQFTGDISNGVSVWLRARNHETNGGDDDPTVSPGSASAGSSATYTLKAPADPDGAGFNLDFQFSPRDGDTVDNSDYFLELALDKDPTAATDFTGNIFSLPMFDSDTTMRDSWDDGGSFAEDGVTSRAGGTVAFNNPTGDRDSDNLPSYAVANSWRAGWDFLLGDDVGAPRNGLFDLRFTAFEYVNGAPGEQDAPGAQLARVQVTADVAPVPAPAALPLLLAGLGGLGLVARRKRKGA